ncbi:hypothetical protein BH18ACI3_BH18ACI3_02550 [soil metagenome]
MLYIITGGNMNTVFPKFIIEDRAQKSIRIVTKTREEHSQLRALLRELANPNEDGRNFKSILELNGKNAQA